MDIRNMDSEYIAHTYGRFPVQLDHGSGSLVWDVNGKEYIDLGGGIAVNIFGFSDKSWCDAVCGQLSKLQHTSNLYYSEPCALLAKQLCEKTGMKKAFFSNSGAEANECAIKAARRRAFLKYGDESHSTVITLKNSFHGRTITTLSATGQDVFHTEFGPFTPGFVYAEAGDIEDVRRLASEHGCAAVMIETVQGEGGVNVLDSDFVRGIYELCRNEDMLLIVDEVQTGNGRTGELYSYMYYGIEPDVVTTAKGLAGGLPMAATMLGERAAEVYTPGSHGSTFGGNPVCAAGALNVLSRIDGKLLESVKRKSAYIISELDGARGVKCITGRGLMLGIECEKSAKSVVDAAMERGVLALTAKSKVRLLPALNIPDELLCKAVKTLREVIGE